MSPLRARTAFRSLELAAADALPIDDVPSAIAALAAMQQRLAMRLLIEGDASAESPASDRLLTVEEAAERSRMSRDWWYRHGKRLPFAKKLGRSLRFSEAGLVTWLNRRSA